MGSLSQTAAERNVLTTGLVERDHEIIWRDVGSGDYVVVQCLQIVRRNPQCAHQTMLNRVRDLAETSLGIASFEDMDLGEGHVESPLLVVTLSRSTCAISGFSCLLGRLSTSVGFTRRMDMACMNMYLHTRLMRSGI